MRLLVVTNMYPLRNPSYPYAGVFVKEQIDALRKIISVDLLVVEGFKGVLFYFLGFFNAWRKAFFGGYDVIHVHYGLAAFFVFFLPLRIRKRIFVTLHGGDILEEQGKKIQVFISKRVIKMVAAVVVVSQEMYEVVKAVDPSIDCVVLPCGVDESFFQPRAWSSDECPVFLFPGDPSRWVKNYPKFEEIVSYFPGAIVCNLHHIERDYVPHLMRSCNVLLLTSHSEGSPQVIKEGLASDMCIVASKVGDVVQQLSETAGTATFDLADDSSAIAQKIVETFLIAKKTTGARRTRLINSGYANSVISKSLFEIYKERLE